MSITINSESFSKTVTYRNFAVGEDFTDSIGNSLHFTGDAIDVITGFVNESADDGSADGAYADLLSLQISTYFTIGTAWTTIDMSSAFFEAHVGTTITFEVVLNSKDKNTGVADGQAIYFVEYKLAPSDPMPVSPSMIQDDYLAIMRLTLPLDQATTEANAINAGTTTETIFVGNLLSQAANTTIPAVGVEGSMYGAVGTSNEITKLVTLFLPAQVANAIHNGLNPQVYACEVLGLAFAFSNENGATTFATNFGPGPTNPGMSATPAGDAFFAAAAASAIFGSAANAGTPTAILGFVTNWEAFYTSHGVPGIQNATLDQIALAARGAAWGDAVGVALANHLGPLPGQVINFLDDAARGGAIYSASLTSQPSHAPFQGGPIASTASQVELVGSAAPFDHVLM
jgi:hypothetical protein